ncbi:MAG TPA: hypothetical protein VMY69_01310, partial [Phycisphaerae bacterium]|nr:hypothetical protein [Phycisphaerae bacterium]
AVFDGFQRMWWSLVSETGTFQMLRLAGAAVAMVVVGLAWTGLVTTWAVAYALAAAAVGVELILFLRRERQPILWRRLPVADMVRDAFFMFLPTAAPMLFTQAGVLVAWVAVGNEASATFWVTWSLSLAISILCGPVGRVLFPAIPNLHRSADPLELHRVLRRAFWGVSLPVVAFILGVQGIKGWLLTYLHQEEAGPVLTILLAAAFFEVLRVVFNPVLLASGMEKPLTLLEWTGLVMVVVGGYLAASLYGVLALAGVFMGVFVASAAVRIALLSVATGVRLWIDAVVMVALVLGISGAVLLLELHGGV